MEKHVYVDESGNESLQLTLPNISSFYVVCALVVDSTNSPDVIKRFEEVRARYFNNREMKSSSVRNRVQRLQILQELAGVEFSLHLLIGNKKLITSPGLRYPKSFIKYLHGFLYKEIVKDYLGVRIYADKIKNPSFMKEMEAYLDQKNLIGLFDMNSFGFVDSKDNVCVQAADFIGGSVRECFEQNPQTAMTDDVMEKLKWRVTQFMPFPESYGRYIAKIPGLSEHDHAIEARAVLEAEQFLQSNAECEEMENVLQMAVVRVLLMALSQREDSWVQTSVLMDHLNTIAPEEVSEQYFRSIIGKLRDAGVLIASRSAGGYKLPTSMADITEFLNRQNSQLAPMIHRIRTARETVLRATGVDILALPEFQNLKAAVTATSPWYESIQNGREINRDRPARLLDVPAFHSVPSSIVATPA
jgi:hypothetical protein